MRMLPSNIFNRLAEMLDIIEGEEDEVLCAKSMQSFGELLQVIGGLATDLVAQLCE